MDTTHAHPKRVDIALLLIRIAAGLVFLYHGSDILFGFFGTGLQKFTAFTHMPMPVAVLVGLAEFCGGLAILTGVLTRLGAACTAIVMIGAILMVHLSKGFNVSKGGMEYALTQFLISVALIFTGAGRYSLAALLPSRTVPR
jgi:putative oxidoreductase